LSDAPNRGAHDLAAARVGAWDESIVLLIIGLSVAMNDVHGYTLI
jgi:hypothetical protein